MNIQSIILLGVVVVVAVAVLCFRLRGGGRRSCCDCGSCCGKEGCDSASAHCSDAD